MRDGMLRHRHCSVGTVVSRGRIRCRIVSVVPSHPGRLATTRIAGACAAVALVGGHLILTTGCSSKPAAATPLVVIDPLEPASVGVLSDSQQRQVEGAFDDLAQGHTAGAIAKPAPSERGRWSDVHLAVLYACDEIEAAVVQRTKRDWGWEYYLRTAEDWPGTLMIRRADAARVYEASASIGIFGDRTERAEALLEAFAEQMRDFGRKPQFPEDDDR
jgi:hypothetical protein